MTIERAEKAWCRSHRRRGGLVRLKGRKHELTLSSFVPLHATRIICSSPTSEKLTHELWVGILLVGVSAKAKIIIHRTRKAVALSEHPTSTNWWCACRFEPWRRPLNTA